MGYRAPSAEEVYRYVSRLDQGNRSLTDGFGFSIVFVNDGSSVCWEFIDRYFVELCHRTADRIRIIFFSELSDSYFRRISEQMYSSPSLREGGLLGAVIAKSTSQRSDNQYIEVLLNDFLEALHLQDYREVDWLLSKISSIFGPRYSDALYRLIRKSQDGDACEAESSARELISMMQDPQSLARQDRFQRLYYDHWRDLTPSSMDIVDAPERTYSLSFEKKMQTVMPGVGESMRFAARFGIGCHVPCFVFFTDVGNLSIDVLPIDRLPAGNIYRRLRSWIDKFYEENRVFLDRWRQVENDITTFTNSINQPVKQLRSWLEKGDDLWKDLRSTAQVITKLSLFLSTSDIQKKSPIDNFTSSSWKCNQIVLNSKRDLEIISNKRQCLESIIQNLEKALDFEPIYDAFFFASEQSLSLSNFIDLKNLLCQSIKLLDQERLDPKTELIRWHKRLQGNFPSLNAFKKFRNTWEAIDKKYNESVRDTYIKFLNEILAFPLSLNSEEMVERAQIILANIIKADIHSSNWKTAFSEYSKKLTSFFRQLNDSMPRWLSASNSNFKVLDIIPFQDRGSINSENIVSEMGAEHPLYYLLQKAMFDWNNKYNTESKRIALRCRDEALSQLLDENLSNLFVKAERDIYSECLSSLRSLRDSIEKDLVDLQVKDFSNICNEQMRLVTDVEIKQFVNLLDEYDRTVNNFIYPYKRDPLVQSIYLDSTISQVLNLKVLNQNNPSNIKRQELEQTIHISKSGIALSTDAQNCSFTIAPKERLAHEFRLMGKDLEPSREDAENLDLALPNNLEEKLYGLSDDEFKVVAKSIARLNSETKSREEVITVILAIVGLIPARELAIHRHYANRPINVEVTTVTDQSKRVEVEMNFHAPVTGATGKNDGVININASEQKQTLAEAAVEIQQLLRQLEEASPSATELEQVAYVDCEVQPSLKHRTIAALKAGGETAIDEFFLNNKYLKVGKAVVKAWLEPSS